MGDPPSPRQACIVKIRDNDIEHSDPDEWYLDGAFEHE